MVNREKGETVTDFLFLGFKITLMTTTALKLKAMTNIDSALKGSDITSQRKVHVLKAMVFWGFPGSSASKNQPAMQETLIQFLGQKDLLEKG